MYKLIVLSGLPNRAISNSDNPKDSFHARDTFAKHPLIPNAWKFVMFLAAFDIHLCRREFAYIRPKKR